MNLYRKYQFRSSRQHLQAKNAGAGIHIPDHGIFYGVAKMVKEALTGTLNQGPSGFYLRDL